jgi:crotonobetainyl-CoA:carnitine CoA-transferase CaiB-like acyl-CoA transferase
MAGLVGPLNGLTVIELGTFITGPAAGMLLGDLGADVIKVERPGTGDPFRAHDGGLYSAHFQTYNRNKRSVTLDPKDPADLEEFDALIARADIFIQNFRPGAAERMNVGPERLRAINPRLIYCSISGYGSYGPDRDKPAFDTVAQAASGFLRLLVNPQHARVVGPAIADSVTGFYAAYGVLAALHRRAVTGEGAVVETSMLEAMCHFNLDDFTHLFAHGEVMGPTSRPHVSQSYIFCCADDRWLALHMSSPVKFWEGLAEAVGMPEMLDKPEFATRAARIANYEGIVALLAPKFAAQPRQWWLDRLASLDVPHAAVSNSREVTESAQAEALGLVVESEGPEGTFRTIRSPVRFDGAPIQTVSAPPELGAHNAEILGPRHHKLPEQA